MASSADFYNSGLFFNERNPFALARLDEANLMEGLLRDQNQPFTQQQAQQMIAPNAPGTVMGMPGAPTLPPGAPQAQGQPMPPPAPQGPPQPQGGGLNAFLGSPGMAMASAALSNLGNSAPNSRGRQVDPVQAYQQAVQRRALLKQQEQMAALRAAQEQRLQGAEGRAAEKFQISKDPAYDYRKLVEEGLIDPEKTTFLDYQRSGLRDSASSVQKIYATWLATNPDATQEEKQDALDNIIRAPIKYGTGAGSTAVTSGVQPGAPGTQLTTPNQMINADASLAGATEGAKQGAQTQEQELRTGLENAWSANEGYNDAQAILQSSQEYLKMLEQGQVDTGFIPSMLFNTFGIGTEELASMNNESVMQALRNLGITNLAPVTEQEFANVMKLWATIGLEEAPNKGSVRTAIKRTERLTERMKREAVVAARRVRQYGGQEAYDNLVATNPFVASQVQPKTDTDTETELEPATDDLPPDPVDEEWGFDANGNPVKIRGQ